MEPENVSIDLVKKVKKKRAMIIAGIITFLIFVLWSIYFVGHTQKEISENKSEIAFFEDLKENTRKPWEEIKTFFANIKDKFAVVAPDTSIPDEATTTEDNLK